MGTGSIKRASAWLLLIVAFVSSRPAFAIPAFARKYGLPCSACHATWPLLNNFGQTFKDNGYQLGNGRDAPIYQQPDYWPITFRVLQQGTGERNNGARAKKMPAIPPAA